MAKLFNKIRKQLISEKPSFERTTNYLKYAIGEIFLVVIGILIALQINNWNENRQLEKREIVLLKELKTNLKTNILNLENDIETQSKSIYHIDYILSLPIKKIPYNNSIPISLQIANYAPDVVLSSSAFETLKSTGLELIKNDILRQTIINLFEVQYPLLMQETRRLEDQLWPTAVIPLYQKHFRSVDKGWVPNNYNNWLKDTEFFNMLSFRRALRVQSTEMKTAAAKQTNQVVVMIENELKNRIHYD